MHAHWRKWICLLALCWNRRFSPSSSICIVIGLNKYISLKIAKHVKRNCQPRQEVPGNLIIFHRMFLEVIGDRNLKFFEREEHKRKPIWNSSSMGIKSRWTLRVQEFWAEWIESREKTYSSRVQIKYSVFSLNAFKYLR